MFFVFTNIYNKKTKGPTLMELFTATGNWKKRIFFRQLEMFDVCTTGDTAHIVTISNVLVTLCSGTDEPHSGSGRDFRLAGI
jgi:hypothetical protein